MSLTSVFLSRVPAERRASFAAVGDLEAELSRVASAGRAVWREIPLEPHDFAAFLGRSLSAEAAGELGKLRADDLYLACAYALGAPGASDALERQCMARVRSALRKVGTPAAIAAEIEQDLRQLLVEASTSHPSHSVYAGKGDLGGWLCVCALREASRRCKRRDRERPLREADEILWASADEDPETAFLHKTYKRELGEAFHEALASLSAKQRNVLRYHFVDKLSIDRIGLLYGVHRATAARWLQQAQVTLHERTRDLAIQRLSLSHDELQRILWLIRSQVALAVAREA